MTNDELLAILKSYEGRTCRISSSASNVAWRANEWPTIAEAYVNPLGEVWVRAEDGASWLVTDVGLTIELQPAVGTYDYAAQVDKMRAIGTVLRMWNDEERTDASPKQAWVEDDRGLPRKSRDENKGGPDLDGF